MGIFDQLKNFFIWSYGRTVFTFSDFHHRQLIKQLSATPQISALGTPSQVIPDLGDPQAALRANKEVFFFRLVRFEIQRIASMIII
jgi:hypothetical protein